MEQQIYGDDIEVGISIPLFERKTDLMNWNRWAATYDEFVPYHMDDEGAKSNGQNSVIGQGRIRVSYLHTMLRNWIGEQGFILEVDVQMRGINYKNDTLTCNGTVTSKTPTENNSFLLELDISITNQNGVVITPGTARVRIPASP
jgi:acyl dehydratase|tara:strand:+ start:322 stop:756 length:435 start_codon:yes stop_codon:yes gene_type:complete